MFADGDAYLILLFRCAFNECENIQVVYIIFYEKTSEIVFKSKMIVLMAAVEKSSSHTDLLIGSVANL